MGNRCDVLRFLGVALLLQLCPQPLAAQAGGWQPVTRADLESTPDLKNRDPITLDMRASGDFNGDGTADSAYVLINRLLSEFRVLACLSQLVGPCDERVVTSGPISHITSLGIDTVRRATLPASRVRAEVREPLLATMRRSTAPDFLHVFAFEASDALYLLTSQGFERVQVTD